jgi:hypothetical protein
MDKMENENTTQSLLIRACSHKEKNNVNPRQSAKRESFNGNGGELSGNWAGGVTAKISFNKLKHEFCTIGL